jgi:hypothetical protein
MHHEASDRFSSHAPETPVARDLRTDLLNARWHGIAKVRGSRRCGVCLERVSMDEQVVRRAGEAFHAACAILETQAPSGASG